VSDKPQVMQNLGDVQKTLFLPLWGRAIESQKKKPLLVDKVAVEILNEVNFDFAPIAKKISEITRLGWIARGLSYDNIITQFYQRSPDAIIVNIGCGLDTTFDRIDNGYLQWYDLDLPDVIELRKHFISETERRKFIASSFLDYKWLDLLTPEKPILFMAAGVFYYFDEKQIRGFFTKLADLFPGCEIVFDASSPVGVKMANRFVIKNSGLDQKSFLKWGLKDARKIESWNGKLRLIGQFSAFDSLRSELNFRDRLGTFITDLLKIQYMVHLKVLRE
jgi:O-methyltransferase involved in polyketide biosynthesis